jgi:hypothetical protein
MIEKRAAARRRVLKHGTVSFGGGGIDCLVRNISASGARVDVDNLVGVPASFTLVIETDRLMRHCHAVWSHDKRIGVAFD